MTKTRAPLALELLFLIIDFTMENELKEYQDVFAPFTASTMYQIILSCQTFHDYVIKQDKYQQLRLWRLLNRIPKQFEPVQVALGTKEHFTIVSIDMSAEKIIPMMMQQQQHYQNNNIMETFLVLQETTSSIRSYYIHNDYLVKTKLSISDRWSKRLKNKMNHKKKKNRINTGNDDIRHKLLMEKRKMKKHKENDFSMIKSNHINEHSIGNNNDDDDSDSDDDDDDDDDDDTMAISLFPLSIFIQYIKWYAEFHDASIWLWKRSARYFKGEEVDLLFQHEFRYILDTTRHALIAWDRPSQNNFRFTDHVLNSNVELFSKLLPTT